MGKANYKILVLDGYPKEHRELLSAHQGTLAGELYAQRLRAVSAQCEPVVAYPADLDFKLPTGTGLSDFDGIVWTGSSLTIHDQNDKRVERQIRFAQSAYEANVPMFGSCWAAQMAVTAAGGQCGLNPKGREFGIARKISLTSAGRGHPMYAGKGDVFDGFTSHQDEITNVPSGAVVLASNNFTSVQAVDVTFKGGSFWAVQYHPEYDLHEIASLCRWRKEGLTEQGNFSSIEDAVAFIDKMQNLHEQPSRTDLRWQLGIDDDVLNTDVRHIEIRNWLNCKVFSQT